MKKVIHLSMMLLMLVFAACSQNADLEPLTSDSKIATSQLSMKQTCLDSLFHYQSWTDMAEDCVHGDVAVWLNKQGLKLCNYELTDETISVSDNIIDFDKDAMLPVYGYDYAKIDNVARYSSLSDEVKNEYLSLKANILGLYKNQTLGKVKFVWEYNGQKIISYGYVSHNIIVYDDVLMNIKELSVKRTSNSLCKRRMQTRTEKRDSYSFMTEELTLHFCGVCVARAFASFKVTYMGGAFLVEDLSATTSTGFWTAVAKVERDQTTPRDVCTIKYVVAVGSGGITITEENAKFIVIGAHHYISGSKSYHASQFTTYDN